MTLLTLSPGSCDVPRSVCGLRPLPKASPCQAPFPASGATHGDGAWRQIKKKSKNHNTYSTVILQITVLYEIISHPFCPQCFGPCPACSFILYILFFLPGNWRLSIATKKCPFTSKVALDQLENSDSKLEHLHNSAIVNRGEIYFITIYFYFF